MRGKTQNVAITLERLCECGSSEFLVLPFTFINAMGSVSQSKELYHKRYCKQLTSGLQQAAETNQTSRSSQLTAQHHKLKSNSQLI